MIRQLIVAMTMAALPNVPAAAQFRDSGRPSRAAPPPKLTGIDALRADFLAATGGDTVFFGGSSATLGVPAKTILQQQAAWLRRHPEVVVKIEGHSDAAETRDRALAIAARRAEEVRDYLILFGVPPGQLSTTNWGKERVAVDGFSEAALAANRRVQTILVRLAP